MDSIVPHHAGKHHRVFCDEERRHISHVDSKNLCSSISPKRAGGYRLLNRHLSDNSETKKSDAIKMQWFIIFIGNNQPLKKQKKP